LLMIPTGKHCKHPCESTGRKLIVTPVRTRCSS
jgi:hypothetical protein